jgi:Tfp pilus assembly protein PilN
MQKPVQININLLETKPRFQSPIFYGVLGIIVFTMLAGFAGFFYMWQSRELDKQQAVNNQLKAEVKKHEKEMAIFRPIQEMNKDMAIRSQQVEELEKMRISHADIMREIDKVVPPKVIMVGIEIKAQKVVITGFSPDHSQVARLLDGLKSISRFKNVTVLASQMGEKNNEADFTIEMDWEGEKK